MMILAKYEELEKALEQNDLQEVRRLAHEFNEHCCEIALDSELICDSIVEELSSSDKKSIRLQKGLIQFSEEKYSDWAHRKSINDDPLTDKEDVKEETSATAEVVINEQKVPDSESPSVALEEDATTRAMEASCSALPDDEDEKTEKRWFNLIGGWGQGTSSSPVLTVLDRVATETEDKQKIPNLAIEEPEPEAGIATDDGSEGTVGVGGAVVSEVSEDLKVDMDSFKQLIKVLDNTEVNTLVAAPNLPILHLVQSLVGLSFKKHKELYQNLRDMLFHFLSLLSPLQRLNGVVGGFLRAEATEMESVVDLSSGLGSIVSYCEKKTSERETEDNSEGVPDEVYEIKKAIYCAVHGNYDDELNAEDTRSFINEKVKNSHVKRHVTMGHDTNNLLMHVLNLYFVVALLSELSIGETFRHLSKESSLIKSVKDFARRSANPEVVFDFDVEMKVIDFLFTYVTPALERDDLLDDAWEITCCILWKLNKIVTVGSKACPEARKNDQRKKKFISHFRALECQTISGTDTSAAVFWSGTDELHSARRLKAIRTFAVHSLRGPIEKSLSIDYFTKLGFTRSFLYISTSSIGRECTFITPKFFSKCQDSIPKKTDNMMKNLSKKDSTGKRTIFIEDTEQRNSLKLLLDAYEELTLDSRGNLAV